jgi:hypothetical protein
MRASRLIPSAVLIAALVGLSGANPATAQSRGSTAPDARPAELVGNVISDEDAQAAVRYWTPERMAAARPAPVPAGRDTAAAPDEPTAHPGRPRVIAQPGLPSGSDILTAPTSQPELPPAPDPDSPVGGDPQQPKPQPQPQNPPVDLALQEQKMVGRVFYNYKGFLWTCSGTAVNSANSSLVWTAAHCLSPGHGKGWHTNWVFIPGYGLDGFQSKSYGIFPALRMESYSKYYFDSNMHYDIGAVVVGRSDGARLLSRIGGGHGLVADLPRDSYYEARGYPGDFQDQQYSCEGTLYDLYFDSPDGWGDPHMMRLGCKQLPKGASGGPWVVDMTCDAQCPVTGYGWVASVVSQAVFDEDTHQQITTNGPYQTDLAWVLYDMLANHPVP